MATITGLMRAVASQLDAVPGVRATADPRNLNPTGVIIGFPSLPELDTMCGGLATWNAYVVGPGPGNLDAWDAIEAMAELVAGVIDVESAIPVQYQHDSAKPALPALQLTWTSQVDWPAHT